MDRRAFLRGTLVSIAAASIVSPAMARSFKPNKYVEALRLYDECVLVKTNELEVSKRLDTLLVYCRNNFAVPEFTAENAKLVRGVLYNGVPDIRALPPTIAETVFPVALVKMALTYDNMHIDLKHMTEFDWFHKTYGKLIIEGCTFTPAEEAERAKRYAAAARADWEQQRG